MIFTLYFFVIILIAPKGVGAGASSYLIKLDLDHFIFTFSADAFIESYLQLQ